MRPNDLSPGESGQPRAPLLLPIVRLLVLTITWATPAASFAVSFSLGDELVTIGQNFTGGSFATSGFFPPDTMGAVGPTAFVELLNGQYSVYDKNSGARLETSTLNQFWNNAGVSPTRFAFDPRVVYDPFSERYLALSVDNSSEPNNFLLAASKTSDPTQGWSGVAISSDPTKQRWADYPTLGFNRDGVYLSANMFPVSASDQANTIVAVPKRDLFAPTPTVAHATVFENNNLNSTGFTVQPAVDLDKKKSSAILLSSPFGFADRLKRSDIIGDIRSPMLTTGGLIPLTPFP